MTRSKLLGLGHHAPTMRVTNAELEQRLGLEPGWIVRRTGIEARHIAEADEAVSDIALPAAGMALEQAGVARESIALTLLATSTPDHPLPPSSPLLAHKLGLKNSGALDVAGACTGFLSALALADGFVRAHKANVLIVAANILSRRLNPEDRDSAVLFADAAGAAVIGPSEEPGGILGLHLSADASGYDLLQVAMGGSRQPYAAHLPPKAGLMKISKGDTAFAQAVKLMTEASLQALAQAGITAEAIDHWAPHQANMRIIEKVRGKLGIAQEKTLLSLAEYGNSSAATIPLTLSLHRAGRGYRPGEKLLLSAVGAGFLAGALVFAL